MRKWKCVELNKTFGFTEGKVYEVEGSGTIYYDDGNESSEKLSINGNEAKCWLAKFVEVKDFTKSDLQECDVVIFRNKERLVYFGNQFMYEDCGSRALYAYKENLKRSDSEKQFDVMQVYRNGQLIFNREEKSQRDIKIKELQDKMDAIKREMEELK